MRKKFFFEKLQVHKQRAQPSNLIESVKRALSSKSKMESNTNGKEGFFNIFVRV